MLPLVKKSSVGQRQDQAATNKRMLRTHGCCTIGQKGTSDVAGDRIGCWLAEKDWCGRQKIKRMEKQEVADASAS